VFCGYLAKANHSIHCTPLNKPAVKALTSLWLMDRNPPQGQVKACSTLKGFIPQKHVCEAS